MKTHNRTLDIIAVLKPLFILAGLFSFSALARADYKLDISQINDVTHIEVPDIVASDYQLNHKGNTVEFSLNGLDGRSAQKLKNYSDQHIKKITISKSKSLDKDIVTITLKGNDTQVFDYLTDAPSALSVDFYVDDKEDAKTAAKESDHFLKEDVASGAGKELIKTLRGPASSEFLKVAPGAEIVEVSKDGSSKKETKDKNLLLAEVKRILDFDSTTVKFKPDVIIETRGKLFIKFPVLINQNTHLNQVIRQKIFYAVENAEDEETKTMLRVKDLFAKNDLKNFLRAKKVFTKKFPHTKFMEMLIFMEADALYDLAQEDKNLNIKTEALKTYDAALAKYPNSPLAERTILFLASVRLEQQEYFGAIRNLKTYIEKYKGSPLRDTMDIYLAHSLLRVKQNDEALKIFERLIKSPDAEISRQATFEIGDAYFEKKDYKKAIALYEQAWAKYPTHKKEYPNAYYNKAEAEFVEERYQESLLSFQSMLKDIPQDPYSSYAWARMGEIFEISEDSDKYKAYYNEGMFRFEKTSGGAISKVHLLSHQIAKAEDRRVPILLNEIRATGKLIQLPQADEFVAFQVADAMFMRGLYAQATDELIGFFKKVKIPANEEKFHRRIGRSISYQIRDHLAKGELEAAFKVFENYDRLWFKKSERIDFDYLKGQALEKSKLYSKALAQYKIYNENYKKLAAPEEVSVFEALPVPQDVQLSMAYCAYHAKDYSQAKEILAKLNMSKLTAERQNQAFIIQAQLAHRDSDESDALDYIAKITPMTTEATSLKADILSGQKKYKEAIAAIDNHIESEKVSTEDKFVLLKEKIKAMGEIGMNDKFYSFLGRFFDEYKKTNNEFDSEKYKLGSHYLSAGKTKEAEEVFATIQDGTMWKKLSNESLTAKKWEGQYKKYIERIPAMAEPKGEKK